MVVCMRGWNELYYFERGSDNKRSEMSGMFPSTDEMQYEMQQSMCDAMW